MTKLINHLISYQLHLLHIVKNLITYNLLFQGCR